MNQSPNQDLAALMANRRSVPAGEVIFLEGQPADCAYVILKGEVQVTVDDAKGNIVVINRMHGGELFVPQIPSMHMMDLARAIAPDAKIEFTGIRPGEKLHEEMISVDDARRTLEADGFYVVQPDMDWWVGSARAKGWDGAKPVPQDFRYTSDTNNRWLTIEELRAIVNA